MKLLAIILVVGSSFLTWAQPKRILLTNGFLHVGNGETMESALVGIVDGKIISVKNSLATTVNKQEWDTIINLNGQHIYPGFVAPNSTLGLTEIDAVRATRDFDDVGEFNPHVRTQIAYNAESKVISTVKTNGVLITQATPRGGIISGTSSVMFLSGWNWEDATIQKDDGIHLNWPSSTEGGGWWAEPAPKKRNENYEEEKQKIKSFFKLAQAYANAKDAKFDLRLEAMKACFNGNKRVFFHADDIQQLLDVMDFVKEFSIKYPVIIGGYDAHLIGKRFKDANIPVMLTRVHSLPEMDEDAVDLPYKLPYLLQQQGIKFCLQNTGDMETMNARNIPFLAGTAMAYGLTEEEALRAISLSSCEILGIDKLYGSIQVGKSATLFVSEGPALDMRTNKVSLILVNGKFESATNFQTDLYNKYKKKYEEKQK
jgi:imidazolonepropionase-like amidohydrolase